MIDIFDKTVSYYAQYRLEPPQAVLNELKKIVELNGQERLLDVGCGPGTSTFFFSSFFKDIIALDSNNLMIQEGINQASQRNITNITWICSPVETVNLNLIGKVDIVIFANSFHWMNQSLVLNRFKDLVTKGGAIMGGGSSWSKKQKQNQIIVSTIREFVGEKRQTVLGDYNQPKATFKEIIDGSPFTFIERKLIHFKHEFTVEELIGLQLSTSYANESLLGTKKADFVNVLNQRLEDISENGIIKSNEVFELILFSR